MTNSAILGLMSRAGGTAAVSGVFSVDLYTGTAAELAVVTDIDLDTEDGMVLIKSRGGSHSNYIIDTIRGHTQSLATDSTDAEETSNAANDLKSFNDNGFTLGAFDKLIVNEDGGEYVAYTFQKFPGFFDIVTYLGTGVAHTEAHSLTVVPEMTWIADRDNGSNWMVYHGYNTIAPETDRLVLNSTGGTLDDSGAWNDTLPTDSVFTVGTEGNLNANGANFVAYLFATLVGTSKCGSFSHINGTPTNVDCEFVAGARMVLAKRTDNLGAWYMWDSERGIIAGNDPYIKINDMDAETTDTDYIDPLSAGFTVAADFLTGDYIFYAVA